MLGRVIAHLRNLLPRMGVNTASPTLSVGPVCPEPTTQTGKAFFAGTTSRQPRRQRQPVNRPALQNKEVVPLIKAGLNSGKKTQLATTGKKSKEIGKKSVTIAAQTRQPVSQAPKAKREPALQTPRARSQAPVKAPAPTPTDSPSGENGKHKADAPRTRQPAKPAAKPKQKPAKRASSGKKTTRAKASAPTRTAKRSGASGTS
jgi:hypothetical protein